MKKLILFFAGIVLLALMCGALVVAGVIYDTGDKMEIETYMFQPNNLSQRRIGVPATVEDLGDSRIFQLLVRKYITEYFYVLPDVENAAMRMSDTSTLSRMSAPSVFEAWQTTEGEVISQLAEDKALRTVSLLSDAVKEGDYWAVEYQTYTWPRPNDLTSEPVASRGRLLLQIMYEPGFRTVVTENGVDWFLLHQKYDPALLFRFSVTDIDQG